MRKIILAFALVALCAGPGLAQQRIRLTGPTTFYVYGSAGAPANSDSPGCGPASAPCTTFSYLWNQLANNYDLAGQPVLIQLSANNHTDSFVANGPLMGQTGGCRQVELIGSMQDAAGNGAWYQSFLVTPSSGDAIAAINGASFSVGGLMYKSSGVGQGGITAGQYGHICLLGELLSQGAPSNPDAMNDMTANFHGLIEMVPPGGGADIFGITPTGKYLFNGPGQCAFDAGDLGEIVADGNGSAGLFNFFWNGQTYSAGTACANDNGVVQLENITHHGSISGPEYDIITGGTVDAATTGLPHSTAGHFTPNPGFTGP